MSYVCFYNLVDVDAISVYTSIFNFSGIKVDEIDIMEAEPAKKPPRRVLPEHEGRYKVTLPAGTTERSKEILAKKATCKLN